MTLIRPGSELTYSLTLARLRLVDTPAASGTCAPDEAVAEGARPDAATALGAYRRALACPQAGLLQLTLVAQLDRPSAPQQAPATPEVVVEGLRAGHAATEAVYTRGAELTNTAAQAIALASQLSGTGRITTTGTLTRSGQTWRYAAQPNDRLVVPSANGGTTELTFRDVRGDLRSVDAFFAGDHSFSFRAVERDRLDMLFGSTRSGQTRTLTAEGTITHEGTTYTADLRYSGTERAASDNSGNERESRYTMRGTVRTEDFRLTVDETADIRGASAEVRNGLSARDAASIARTIDSTLTAGEDTYRWRDSRIQMSFRNGRPSQVDTFWRATGSITRNGEQFGTYRLDAGQDRLRILLGLPDQELELHAFPMPR